MAQKYSRTDIIRELQRVFTTVGKPFTRRQFGEVSDLDPRTVEKHFGTWNKALEETGLKKKFDDYNAIHKEMSEFDPSKQLREDWEQEKESLKQRAEEREMEWWKSQLNKMDVVKEMIEESISKIEPLVVEIYPVKFKTPPKTTDLPHCILWFEFSDLQLGTLITAEEMGGLNKHNWIIWKQKLGVWKDEVIEKIKTYQQHYIIDYIVVACLGDMVEGQDIFKGQTFQIDRHVVDQAIYGANDTSAAMVEIALNFPELKFHFLEVFGNHGRTGKKGQFPYSCSMDKVYQRIMELQVGTVKDVKNVTFHRNEAWFYFVQVYGWNHLLLHGDQGISGLWSSRPTVNGLEKGIVRYNQMLQQQIHFVHCGHFHNDWQLSFNMSQMLINGSFIGTSNFSATQMVASSPPVQVMHVFEPRVGLAKTERIYLTDGDVKCPIEPNTLS